MENIKVSVIIPVYNGSKFIEETVKSVVKQDFEDWECIIVNDGSSDNSDSVIKELIKTDNRLIYLQQSNQGVSVARNNGIENARGKYILCLDGDDLISSNFISEMLNIIDKDEEVRVVTSRVKFFGKSNGELKRKDFSFINLLAENQMVVTSMFRKIDFDQLYKFDEKMKTGLEDWDFWIGLLKNGGKVAHASNAIFFYRIQKISRNSSLDGSKQSNLRYQMWLNHKDEYAKYFIDPKITEEYKTVFNSLEYKVGKILIKPLRFLKSIF